MTDPESPPDLAPTPNTDLTAAPADSDDLARSSGDRQALSHRAAIGPVAIGERPIDDDDWRRVDSVGAVEGASLEHRHPERREIAARSRQ